MTVYAIVVSSSSDAKRARIVLAARQLFLRYGIRRTSMDDVAREAGIAKGTVYLYFDSKESLNAAIAQGLCDDSLAAGRAALAEGGSLTERLVAFLDAWIGVPSRLLASSPHTAELIESKEALPAATFAGFNQRMRELLRDALHANGIAHPGAGEMYYAAAIGTLDTGDIAAEPYRARLTAIVETLTSGLRAQDGSSTQP